MADLSGSPETQGFEQKTLSKGCIEMFIGFQNTRDTSFSSSGNAVQTKSAIVGTHNLKNNVKVMMGSKNDTLQFVSIDFKTKGFYEIFKIPSSEINNSVFVSNEVLGKEFKQLQEQLDNSQNNNERKFFLDHFLIEHLNKNKFKRYNIKVGFEIADYIEFHNGNIRISQIVQEFKISERSLQRDFKLALGIPIKEYCMILRFKNLFEYINNNTNINWADMVFQFGYYDQAHMINEFKKATDISPAMFMKHKNREIFKIGNHLAILKPNINFNEIHDVITKSLDSYNQNMPEKN